MVRPPCCDKAGVKKGPWTPEEDIILVTYIQEHGPGNWRAVPTNTGLLRCSKSCRLRWTNYLRPGIKRGNFTEHEEKMIIHLQALLGNRWAAIASYLPQRTDNDIKNHWNTHLKKRLNKLQQGPQEHDQSRDRFSSSSSPSSSSANSHSNLSRGQWERRLQTNIHMAKQALYEALSPAKPITIPTIATATATTASSCESKASCSASEILRMQEKSVTYASSTENIAKLLKGWVKNSPIKTQNLSNQNHVAADCNMKEEVKNNAGDECAGTFESSFGFDYYWSCDSSHRSAVSPDDETKPDFKFDQTQLSMVEDWLFEDTGGQIGDILIDENPNFF